MADELWVENSTLRLIVGDITDLEIDSFVYYAQHDLALGSGFGTAISLRGGPSIQDELKAYDNINTTEVVVTSAGKMKAEHILHAVGPRFQEEDIDGKLRTTVLNCLKKADEKKIKNIAFPAMGAGFYGIPLDESAKISLGTISEYLSSETEIENVTVCLVDNREYEPYQTQLQLLQKEEKK